MLVPAHLTLSFAGASCIWGFGVIINGIYLHTKPTRVCSHTRGVNGSHVHRSRGGGPCVHDVWSEIIFTERGLSVRACVRACVCDRGLFRSNENS